MIAGSGRRGKPWRRALPARRKTLGLPNDNEPFNMRAAASAAKGEDEKRATRLQGDAMGWVKAAAAGLAAWVACAPAAGAEKFLTVAACGDVMMQNVDGGKRLSDEKLSAFMGDAGRWFKSADVGFVNLEGPIGGSHPKGCGGSNCHRFEQGPGTALALAQAGVTAASVANNHTADMGGSGQSSTREALARVGIKAAGHLEAPSARWEAGGLKVELLAMTANGFAPDFRRPGALRAIREAKARSDIVILSLHMGCEGAKCARLQGGKEVYLGEDRGDPEAFSKAAVEAGADLVLGSGPHVPRGMATHRGRMIAYSLGNCAVGPGMSTAGRSGMAPVLWTKLSASGELLLWDVGSFRNDGSRMRADPSEGALGWMLEATRLDSGEGQLRALGALRWDRSGTGARP